MDRSRSLLTARDAMSGLPGGFRDGPPSLTPVGVPPGTRPGASKRSAAAQGTISKDGTGGAELDGYERLLRAPRDPRADQEPNDSSTRMTMPEFERSPSRSSSDTSSSSNDDDDRIKQFEMMVGLDEIDEAETIGYHASLKRAGISDDRNSVVSWQEGLQQSADTNLAQALASVANSYLGINPKDGTSDTAKYLSFLLERIHMLESEVQYKTKQYKELAERTSRPKMEPEGQTLDASEKFEKTSETASKSVEDTSKTFHVLHRVFCGTRYHNHNLSIYEDLPVSSNGATSAGGDTALRGKYPIVNQTAYLAQNPNLSFLVIREHRCTPDPAQNFPGNTHTKPFSIVDFVAPRETPSARFERMKITDPMLQKALVKVAQCRTDEIIFGKNEASWEIEAPYHFIFHHRQKLAELMKCSPEYHPHISPLLEYIHEHFENEYKEAEASIQEGYVNREVVAKLFKPDHIIVSKKDDTMSVYVLNHWPLQIADEIRFSSWSWIFDGRSLERQSCTQTMDIRLLDNTPIRDLPIYPIEFADPKEVSAIHASGKKFWSLRQKTMVSYSGWDFHHDDFYSNKRFMVDVMTFRSIHRAINPPRPQPMLHPVGLTTEKWSHKYFIEDELPEDAFLLLPRSIPGFSLEQKRWVTLHVAQISEVKWNKKAIDRLVMDGETKELIQALVDVHLSSREKMSDIVMSKGNGLIILLHGSPGTGKTLTAECVAEFAEKPLYRVTCGDIGTQAVSAEKYLETVMHLGKIWDCVLLLDEADVFLEERSIMDLQRNSLVSVFLRVLEYYEGILILTSNRVGIFDEAFKSRIQVAVQYNPLSREYRRTIWQNFLNMLAEGDTVDVDVNISEIERRLDELAAIEINGRQIRNALLTARQLALHRHEALDWHHLRDVLKISKRFTQYLKNFRGHNDEAWARSENWR